PVDSSTGHSIYCLFSLTMLRTPSLLTMPPTHTDLLSFPTRRSSDLRPSPALIKREITFTTLPGNQGSTIYIEYTSIKKIRKKSRSEEHTSELQSRFDLVCRLLLVNKETLYILITNTI